jgi:SecD/SecF fusion protein
MDTNKLDSKTSSLNDDYLATQAVEVLRKRVDSLGVAEPLIQPVGNRRIMVQLPGLSEADKDQAIEDISKAAFLEFRLVHPDTATLTKPLEMGESQSFVVPPGYELKYEPFKAKDGSEHRAPIVVKTEAERGLTGEHITRAGVVHDTVTGAPEITFGMDSEGGKIFGQVTAENVGRRLAIILDGEVVSAPTINGPIPTGSGSITGSFDEKEAIGLASALQNPLKTPLHIIEQRGVDPSLGEDSIRSGIKAAVIGVIAVAGFMMVYYLLAGAVANVALLVNVIILLGVMCSLDVTFTLPGIAGIVLTVGMAVDANVLIFERIREEQNAGKSIRGALSAGYNRAFGTIFDSHVTTLISSVLLIVLGTGTVKGFGVSLTIGVAASLFTALVITRLVFDFLLNKTTLLSGGVKMLHLIRTTNLDFMKLAKTAFIVSWAIIVLGLGYGIFVRGSHMLGVEFAGGDDLTMNFTREIDVDKLRTEVAGAKVGDIMIQYEKDLSTQKKSLRIVTPKDSGTKVEALLKSKFPDAGFTRVRLDSVGATIGAEIQQTAEVAALLSLFGILIYVAFRYEFSFAVGAVVAVVHDVLMTIGCYCLTGLFSEGRQFNATFVAALLTIIGFSINDTIVIFDRIREDLKLGIPGTFTELVNRALNQTLSRTLITSGTVFLATLSLYIFGGGAINDFAFTFLVGIITGTYSSIYIASALVLWWHKGQRPVLSVGSATVSVETVKS